MAELKCVVVTPETTAVDEMTSFVALPLFDGELGVAPNHSPMIGRMGFGELRLKTAGGQVLRYYVDGGFVQIADNVVSVMTNRAIPAHSLDGEVIRKQLADANKIKANSPETFEHRDRSITQARAQLRVSQKS